MYPFDIVNHIRQGKSLRDRFGSYVLPGQSLNTGRILAKAAPDFALEDWMVSDERFKHPPVARYIDFLVRLNELVFYKVFKEFAGDNPDAGHEHGDDKVRMGIVNSLFPLSAYLYYLDSFGVDGDILECGCFKGCSTSILSWVAHNLGRKLYAADSFEGLPEPGEKDTNYYTKGNFKGRLDEVQMSVARCGAPWAVEYVVGWYENSLKGWNRPLMCLWIDVDLYSSTMSVIENTFYSLRPGGVLFVDGLAEVRDYSNEETLKRGADESQAMLEYFGKNQITHRAKYCGVDNLGLVVPHTLPGDSILFSPSHFNYLLTIIRSKILGWK